ncbi:MAG: bifunctional metallophosphatase/5'-nucleotidase [Burkholderiales bacterium]|nr:bifunctional metallophosphatase/5'-nucleotidase [Burkholderiales bacterium]MDE2566783.1 bifunctional metallophosphatase/5'-nucleotidase [Burkholderiales bacterium]
MTRRNLPRLPSLVRAAAYATALAAALATAGLAGCSSVPPAPPAAAAPVEVKIIAINDFHGNLLPPKGGIRIQDPARPGHLVTAEAGGAAILATAVARLEAQNPNHIFVAAGDLIGASPLLSALFHDEPTVQALGLAGLEVSAVGNHEFDKGAAELLRIQNGGCSPIDGCKGPQPYTGARYKYLAASTVDERTGRTIFPPYYVKTFQGIPMAFIGLTLKDTPEMVVPAGVAGLRFEDEASTVNRLVPQLQAQGIQAIVVLIHQGGWQKDGAGDYDGCEGLDGPIVGLVKKFDPAVGIVISGHTHRAYNCRIDGRLVTSADKYGTLVTDIDVTLDPRTRRVIASRAHNRLVSAAEYAPDPRETALIQAYVDREGPLATRVVGRLGAALSRTPDAAGESPLGQVIADAQLEATRGAGAQIAFMNEGGIRAALPMPADGLVRYEDVFTAQPFYNNLVTMSLTGAQIERLLEQQWRGGEGRVMMVSRGFSYTWDAARPHGARVLPGSVRLDGRPLDPAATYRVTVNSFMASGGDSFSVLRQGGDRVTGMLDVDALEQYLGRHPGLGPGSAARITRLN